MAIQNSFKAETKEIGIDFLGERVNSWIKEQYDRAKLKELFVDSGKFISNYEMQEKSLLNDLQTIFSKENMEQIYKEIEPVNGLDVERQTRCQLQKLLKAYEVDEKKIEEYTEHFMQMFKAFCRKEFPEIFRDMYMASEFNNLNQNMLQILEIVRTPKDIQKIYIKEERQAAGEKSESGQVIWKLEHVHIEGVFGSKEKRKAEILELTRLWAEERENYPGWYIPPVKVCEELKDYTVDNGLIQYHDLVTVEEMLKFMYELVWRYETGMLSWYGALQHHIEQTWNRYRQMREELGKDTIQDELDEKWEFIGQALLREYREDGKNELWQDTYEVLERCNNEKSTTDLEIEKAKKLLMDFKINKALKCVEKIKPDRLNYGQRIQICGILAESGNVGKAEKELESIQSDIEKQRDTNSKEIWHRLCGQYVSVLFFRKIVIYGAHRQELPTIQEELTKLTHLMSECTRYFDFHDIESDLYQKMVKGMSKKHEEKEPFDIDRMNITLIGGSYSAPADAYHFYRILDKMAIPLQINHVTFIRDMETAWMSFLMEGYPHLAIYTLIRGSKSENVKQCITRKWLACMEQDILDKEIAYLLGALDYNLPEMSACNCWQEGNLYTELVQHGFDILLRLMTKGGKEQQKQLLLLMQKEINEQCMKNERQEADFVIRVMEICSDQVKAENLDVLLACPIRKSIVKDAENDWDVFDFFCYNKRNISFYQKQNHADASIEKLFEQYKKGISKEKVLKRLISLYLLGLLNQTQNKMLGGMLWEHINSSDEMPSIQGWNPEIFVELPHPKKIHPLENLKKSLLATDWVPPRTNEKGFSIEHGNHPFLQEMISLNNRVDKKIWKTNEAESILTDMVRYWENTKHKLHETEIGEYTAADEYRKRHEYLVYACASMNRRINGRLSENIRSKLENMKREMESENIPVIELEVLLCKHKNEVGKICQKIETALLRGEKDEIVDAIRAAQSIVFKFFEFREVQNMLECMAFSMAFDRQTGLNSLLIFWHNLFYENMPISKKTRNDLCQSLQNLREKINYVQAASQSEKEVKNSIQIRRSCAMLANTMFHWYENNNKTLPKELFAWKDECIHDKFVEVRNEWVQ